MDERGRVVGTSSRELEVVKNALARILQEENPLPPHQQQARHDEISRRLSSHGSSAASQTLDTNDLAIISRLLHQVQLLEREELSTTLMSSEMPASSNGPFVNEKTVVETVVQVASAAAEAAKAAAASSGKNVEVMEALLSSPDKTTPHRLTYPGSPDEGRKAHDEEVSTRPSASDKDLMKKLERQNRITHCVLGFMIVATAIWRFKLFSMFIGVRKTFANPFQAFGEMVSEGFKGGNKEDQNGAKGLHKARTVLPSILGGEEKEVSRKVEQTECSTTEDFKIGEALTVSLDNILSVGKSNHDSEKEDSASNE